MEKTGPGNFLPYVNLWQMGQQKEKRLPTFLKERTDSTYVLNLVRTIVHGKLVSAVVVAGCPW